MRIFGRDITFPSVTGMFAASPTPNQLEPRVADIPAHPVRMGVARGWSYDPLDVLSAGPVAYGAPADASGGQSLPVFGSAIWGESTPHVPAVDLGRAVAQLFATPETGGGTPPEYGGHYNEATGKTTGSDLSGLPVEDLNGPPMTPGLPPEQFTPPPISGPGTPPEHGGTPPTGGGTPPDVFRFIFGERYQRPGTPQTMAEYDASARERYARGQVNVFGAYVPELGYF